MMDKKDYVKQFSPNVPDKLKETAIAIMIRFDIKGVCDGMYICNKIANDAGIGDGQGHFTGGEIRDYEKVARSLASCYGANIFKEDISELEEILKTGVLDPEKTVCGLKKYIQKCAEELSTCDSFRVDYLNSCILSASQTLMEFDKNTDIAFLGASVETLPAFVKIICADGGVYEAVLSTPKTLEEAWELTGFRDVTDEPFWAQYHGLPNEPILYTHIEDEFLVSELSSLSDIRIVCPSAKESFFTAYFLERYGFYANDVSEYPKTEKRFLEHLTKKGSELTSSYEKNMDEQTPKRVSERADKGHAQSKKETNDKGKTR